MKKNKVLIFRQQLFKPSETFITSQAENLQKYLPVYIGRNTFGIEPKNSQYILLAKETLYDQIKYVITRCPQIHNETTSTMDIKIIHAHFAVDGVYALPLAKKIKVPLVVTLHGFDVTRTLRDMLSSFKPSFYNYALYKNELLKKVDVFICVSNFIKQKAIDAGFPSEKLITHYIGIDVNKFEYRNYVPNENVILHVARLVEKKGTTYLLRALETIKEKIPHVKLVVIGDGPLMQDLKNEVESLHLKNNVQFMGVQSNDVVKEWLYKSSVMCVPSIVARNGDAEGLGIVNLEAAAIGVPVVAFSSGGIPEAVVNNVTGYLVDEKNVDELAKKILLLLEDRNLNNIMGQNARKFIELNHNQFVQSIKLENIYDDLVELKK